MSDLSPRAASLVRAGRSALRPSSADRERISAALRSRLGGAVLPLEAGVSVSLLSRSAWAKLAAVGAAVGVIGGTAFFALHDSTPVPNRGPLHQLDLQKAAETRAGPAVRPPLARSTPSAALQAKATSEPIPAAAGSARRSSDKLAQEVAILSRATSELHAGHAASALRAIDEHQRKFPNGLLAEERRAARVQALCALGRTGEARPELERLTRTAPQSPNTMRAKQICGSR